MSEMGKSIDPDINMKEDVPCTNEDKKLPILDTKMWVERGGEEGPDQIRYELYEKPIMSRLVTMEQS